MEFEGIVLSVSADYLVRSRDDVEEEEGGVRLMEPYVFTDEETVQRIEADEMLIPYAAVEGVQYGEFTQSTP